MQQPPKASVTSGNQQNCQRDPQTDHNAADCETSSPGLPSGPRMQMTGHCGGTDPLPNGTTG
jgi:hypothetical protein